MEKIRRVHWVGHRHASSLGWPHLAKVPLESNPDMLNDFARKACRKLDTSSDSPLTSLDFGLWSELC